MNTPPKQDLDLIIGPSDKGEYAVGDTMSFVEDGHEYTGEVLHCALPQTLPSGRHLPRTYTVDCGDGWSLSLEPYWQDIAAGLQPARYPHMEVSFTRFTDVVGHLEERRLHHARTERNTYWR